MRSPRTSRVRPASHHRNQRTAWNCLSIETLEDRNLLSTGLLRLGVLERLTAPVASVVAAPVTLVRNLSDSVPVVGSVLGSTVNVVDSTLTTVAALPQTTTGLVTTLLPVVESVPLVSSLLSTVENTLENTLAPLTATVEATVSDVVIPVAETVPPPPAIIAPLPPEVALPPLLPEVVPPPLPEVVVPPPLVVTPPVEVLPLPVLVPPTVDIPLAPVIAPPLESPSVPPSVPNAILVPAPTTAPLPFVSPVVEPVAIPLSTAAAVPVSATTAIIPAAFLTPSTPLETPAVPITAFDVASIPGTAALSTSGAIATQVPSLSLSAIRFEPSRVAGQPEHAEPEKQEEEAVPSSTAAETAEASDLSALSAVMFEEEVVEETDEVMPEQVPPPPADAQPLPFFSGTERNHTAAPEQLGEATPLSAVDEIFAQVALWTEQETNRMQEEMASPSVRWSLLLGPAFAVAGVYLASWRARRQEEKDRDRTPNLFPA